MQTYFIDRAGFLSQDFFATSVKKSMVHFDSDKMHPLLKNLDGFKFKLKLKSSFDSL